VTKTSKTWEARVLTLFPNMFPGILGDAAAGRGIENGLWSLKTINIRDFATDQHGTVDDQPFGGGPGMVMRADILASAIDKVHPKDTGEPIIYLSPRGRLLTQERVKRLSSGPGITIICGRFEGIDERILNARGIEEISVGDYILSGGEPAAQILLDSCVRLIPGIIGKTDSLIEESFENGLLEYPHYTRPRDFEGQNVPEVLLSGDHERIRYWRNQQSEIITQNRRTDLWDKYLKLSRSNRRGQGYEHN
jgi:tRNA (guanine37-N1)-methyltransferase